MTLAGAFSGLAGVVLGSFENCGDIDAVEALMQSYFGPMGIPVVAGVGVGHGERNLTLPLGIEVRLDTAGSELVFLEDTFDQ
jgi:muramoyltetrapeptide carboxypeptidase